MHEIVFLSFERMKHAFFRFVFVMSFHLSTPFGERWLASADGGANFPTCRRPQNNRRENTTKQAAGTADALAARPIGLRQ